MKTSPNIFAFRWLLASLGLLLLTGCDAANIVFASLDLAGAIVNAAT